MEEPDGITQDRDRAGVTRYREAYQGDPLGQQLAGKALWFVLEGIEVIQRLQFAVASEPGIHICRARLGDIVRACTGVVNADRVAGSPAEQRVQRQPTALA
jgi:hypothetical protein